MCPFWTHGTCTEKPTSVWNEAAHALRHTHEIKSKTEGHMTWKSQKWERRKKKQFKKKEPSMPVWVFKVKGVWALPSRVWHWKLFVILPPNSMLFLSRVEIFEAGETTQKSADSVRLKSKRFNCPFSFFSRTTPSPLTTRLLPSQTAKAQGDLERQLSLSSSPTIRREVGPFSVRHWSRTPSLNLRGPFEKLKTRRD